MNTRHILWAFLLMFSLPLMAQEQYELKAVEVSFLDGRQEVYQLGQKPKITIDYGGFALSNEVGYFRFPRKQIKSIRYVTAKDTDDGIGILAIDDDSILTIYNLAGNEVYTGNKRSMPNTLSGIYIVKSGAKTWKMVL